MSDAGPAPPNPALSPSFDRARKLSRFVAVFFTLSFLVMLVVAVVTPVAAVFSRPRGIELGFGWGNGVHVNFAALAGWSAIGAVAAVEIMVAPVALTLYHTFRLFFCFARGQVFAAQTISHIFAAGLGLAATFFADYAGAILLLLCGVRTGIPISAPLGALFTGFAIIIAAYVMAEARRIADENASIL